MKPFLTAISLVLLLSACTSPTVEVLPNEPVPGNPTPAPIPSPTPTPPPVPAPLPEPTNAAGYWQLNLNKSSKPNLRIWVRLSQTGNNLTGRANVGYVTPEGSWIEPYSGSAVGTVQNTDVTLTVVVRDSYDTNEDMKYQFKGVITNQVFSGTWTRNELIYPRLENGSGSFTSVLLSR